MPLSDNFMWFPDADSDVYPQGETTDGWFEKRGAFEFSTLKFNLTEDPDLKSDRESQARSVSRFAAMRTALINARNKPADLASTIEADSDAGRANFNDLTINKFVDLASAMLYKACSKGIMFPSAMLALRKSGGVSGLLYIQYILRAVRVKNIKWSGGGNAHAKEEVSFGFEAIGFQYIQQTAQGRASRIEPRRSSWCWNMMTGCESLILKNVSKPPPKFLAGEESD